MFSLARAETFKQKVTVQVKTDSGWREEHFIGKDTRLEMNLNQSMETVAKALDKPSTGMQSLQRQGFKFTESQIEMAKALENSGRLADAQAIVFAELESSYGGAAEAARDTLGGALTATVAAGGRIIGMGGYGGGGAEPGIAASGGAGGTAIRTVLPLTVDNLGTIAGGGGGGGGGGTTYSSNTRAGGGGGGSGGGVNAGAVGTGGAPTGGFTNFTGYNGYPGNATTGGLGGQQFVVGDGAVGQAGGKGGDLGQNGSMGSNGSNVGGGLGGTAGAYIDGASLTTWGNTGTRLGRSIN